MFFLSVHIRKHQNVWEMGREEGLAELSPAGDAASVVGLPAERSRRRPEQNPGGKSCQFSKQDGKQQITVTTLSVSNWENSLRKVKLFLLPFIRILRVSSQEFSPSPWGAVEHLGVGFVFSKCLPAASPDAGCWQLSLSGICRR